MAIIFGAQGPASAACMRGVSVDCEGVNKTVVYGTYPLGYLDFMPAVAWARLILTDFGWIQDESIVLRILRMNLRDNSK